MTDFLTLIISNEDFIKSFLTEVNQTKTKFLKCEFLSLYLQIWIVSKNLPKEMDRSKQRIFEIFIFYRFGFVTTLKMDFIKNFPVVKDQTERKFLIVNLEQVFDQNHFKCGFCKNHPDQS